MDVEYYYGRWLSACRQASPPLLANFCQSRILGVVEFCLKAVGFEDAALWACTQAGKVLVVGEEVRSVVGAVGQPGCVRLYGTNHHFDANIRGVLLWANRRDSRTRGAV